MISYNEAFQKVLETTADFGVVKVPLSKADGRVLAESTIADRDFPPFNRATKDGIAIRLGDDSALSSYSIEGIVGAGESQTTLNSKDSCVEIMTGAIVPVNADSVVMYEHLEIIEGRARVKKEAKKGQNIHVQGSDEPMGSEVLSSGTLITAAEIGVLASVGKHEVLVKKNPKVTLFSTGDELVGIEQAPKLHQIRQSNSHTLRAALFEYGIRSKIVHVRDKKDVITNELETALVESDVLLMSGGVSKGKYDYIPEVLGALEVQKIFHRVLQRPGKPFWFGYHPKFRTTVFGFPGNPTSTFANFHVYFLPWLNSCLGTPNRKIKVLLEESFINETDLTRFVRAKAKIVNGELLATFVHGNGSGDLTSLTKANGFIEIAPGQQLDKGDRIRFIPTRKIV